MNSHSFEPRRTWSALTLEGASEIREIVTALLQDKCIGTIEDVSQTRLFFEENEQSVCEVQLQALAKEHVLNWHWTNQEAEPWHLAWKDNFKPVNVRNRICIIPDWEPDDQMPGTIRIRPGMAFGTGHHETTWLMIDRLLDEVKPGMKVLDVGTGSGILAIAAHKLGAAYVLGIESDDACRDNFRENLELNDIENAVEYRSADASEWTDYGFDLILANVNRHVILQLIPKMSGAEGNIILSGLLESDTDIVQDSLKAHGLSLISMTHRGEWICMMAGPNNTPNQPLH